MQFLKISKIQQKESEIAHPNLPSTMRPGPTGSDLQILSSLLNLDYIEIHSEKKKAADKDEKFVSTYSSNECASILSE